MEYVNYHKHSHRSNIRTPDSATKEIAYMKRAKELGSNIYSTVEHGYQGDIHEVIKLCEQEEMDYIFGAEFYYVDDRFEKDKTNLHMIIIAKNFEGYKEINAALSEANKTGFYHKPRIDFDIIKNVFHKGNIIMTTACVAGILKNEKLINYLSDHYKEDFFIEVQSHNHISQIQHNKKALEIARKMNINLIHANDSHYIDEEDKYYRSIMLKSKGFSYGDEDEFKLDYPDSSTILQRYKEQGVLSDEESEAALKNTLIFKKCINVASCINKNIKLPKISSNPKSELKRIINQEFKNRELNKLPKQTRDYYISEIRKEMEVIDKTNTENYFLIDYKIVKLAKEKYNGVLTRSGRGSAVSFITNYLLGLTEIDRIQSPIQLYPSRFMSAERILKAASLPDIDLNTSDASSFIKASEDILGKEHCAWMISYKPFQELSAFRMYAKGIGKDINTVDFIAKNIEDYREDNEWGRIIRESSFYIGVIESVAPSPCSCLLYDKGKISEDIGLIKIKDNVCCILDGISCENYKYLKNDYLTTKVWLLIANTCKRANIEIPTIKELEAKLDKKTFDIYRKGFTCTVNQADSDFATNLVMKYKPTSVAEMSAFVAAIRPGFKSLLNNFLERKPYSTNIKELDELLEDSFHYLMYQESIMKYLIWLGVEESKTYSLIKKISKKKFTHEELENLHKTLLENWKEKIGSEEGFERTWKVVEDASKYSFNASHSLSYAYDSLYCAYLKSHYPYEYYTEALEMYSDDLERTKKLTKELNSQGIQIKDPDIRNASLTYKPNKKDKTIYKGLKSVKFMNEEISIKLEEMSHNLPDNFFEVLSLLKGFSNKRQIEILIKLDFFQRYGTSKKLLKGLELYNDIYSKKTFNKKKYKNINNLLKKYAKVETEKQFKEVDTLNLLKELFYNIKDEHFSVKEEVEFFYEYIGSCNKKYDFDAQKMVLVDVKKYSNKTNLKCYSLKYGIEIDFSINNKDIIESFSKYDIISIDTFNKVPKFKHTPNGWEKDYENLENKILKYHIVE